MNPMIRKHFFFSGRVQGVGFRYKAMYLAEQMNLTGWAENLWDGRVEMEVQGNPAGIRELVEALKSDRFIRIQSIEEGSLPLQEDERRFGVR